MYTYSIITGHRVQKWIAFQSVLEYLLTMPCHFLSWPELFPRNHIMVSHCTFFLFFSVFLLSLINFIIIIIYFFLLYSIVLVLPYNNMHPPRVYTCSPSWTPLPPPSPYHPSGSSQCTSPKLPVSCIEPGLVIHFLYDIIHVLMPFSQIISPPSPPESKRLFYTSVSLLLSHIQGCHSCIDSYLYQSCIHFTLTLPMKIILNHDLQNIIF